MCGFPTGWKWSPPRAAQGPVPFYHDAFFKTDFSDPEWSAVFLNRHLPPAVAARIDFNTLALQAGSFVQPDLTQARSALLFSADMNGRDATLTGPLPDPLLDTILR